MRVGVGAALLAVALLSGCQSGFSQFYEDYSTPWQGQLIAPTGDPRVVPGGGNADQVVASMFADGYVLIGVSSFNGPTESRTAAIQQARKVGAERIVLDVQYTNTNQGAIPLTTQQVVTSTTRGTASAYGTGGSAYGTYSGTTTTTVPQTTYIPYSVDRYDQMALYFAPLGPPCFGVLLTELSDEDKRLIGSNRGARVNAVRRGSSAYNADILPGDLVVSVDGHALSQDIPLRRGVSSAVGVRRGTQDLSISVTGGDGCPA
jgi:hypothetical protein